MEEADKLLLDCAERCHFCDNWPNESRGAHTWPRLLVSAATAAGELTKLAGLVFCTFVALTSGCQRLVLRCI